MKGYKFNVSYALVNLGTDSILADDRVSCELSLATNLYLNDISAINPVLPIRTAIPSQLPNTTLNLYLKQSQSFASKFYLFFLYQLLLLIIIKIMIKDV